MAISFFGEEAWAPLARALVAYFQGDREAVLTVHADDGEPDAMPVSLFFRSGDELRDVDREALALARGRVLDVGAGVGSLSLILQEGGAAVTSVEVIPEAVEIMVARGVRDPREGRVEDLPTSRDFDTLLMLMNGAALAGTLSRLLPLLQTLDGLVAPGGQILLDSTDILERAGSLLGDATWDEGEYPGELQYQMEFRGDRGAPFPQLFIDPRTLGKVASQGGWRMELAWQGGAGEFLARLTREGEAAAESC
ncbi:MAG: methyltransferase domain-containing protein [Longimicrobiales bacterium]|nr:methyltransferase domain-containing protein [Longimicrobiales bacterium]